MPIEYAGSKALMSSTRAWRLIAGHRCAQFHHPVRHRPGAVSSWRRVGNSNTQVPQCPASMPGVIAGRATKTSSAPSGRITAPVGRYCRTGRAPLLFPRRLAARGSGTGGAPLPLAAAKRWRKRRRRKPATATCRSTKCSSTAGRTSADPTASGSARCWTWRLPSWIHRRRAGAHTNAAAWLAITCSHGNRQPLDLSPGRFEAAQR